MLSPPTLLLTTRPELPSNGVSIPQNESITNFGGTLVEELGYDWTICIGRWHSRDGKLMAFFYLVFPLRRYPPCVGFADVYAASYF